MSNIIFTTEMINAAIDGKKSIFRFPIESKKIKPETIVNTFHNEFTTFDTSYHTRFTIRHLIKEGDEVLIKEKRKKRTIKVKINKVEVERLGDIDRRAIWCEGIRVPCHGASLPMELYDEYKKYWDLTSRKDYKWKDNPFVYVCTFEVLNINPN